MNTVLFLLFLGKVAAVEGKKCISSLRFGLRPAVGWTVRSEINDGSASKVVISMKDSQRLKLKTPVIYFETGSGSRGAWTGDALLPKRLCSTILETPPC
ncbi:hypothetical protein ABD77_04345 [Brevibacillus formosus]|nr:hypothetical protein [Brevibacillus formosus]